MTKLPARFAGLGVTAALVGVVLSAPAASAAGAFPAFGLPFEPGQSVYSAGIHSDNGTSGVKNAIDFSPGDKTVRAPLAGTVRIQHCSGGDWVTVDHDGGWRTGYYHLEGIAVTDGQKVAPGDALGRTGNALPCGGRSTGAHVHFTLWTLPAAAAQGGDSRDFGVGAGNWNGLSYDEVSTKVAEAYGEAVDGKTFGGWQFTAGTDQYSGTATEVSSRATVPLPGRFRV
ncbi:Peptidase family M23 [Amycolatopsis lurida]|uniref:LasA protease n=1 Tax=Amycolatopsis lurida NRRL 2430 TaxID=1460371 RepID=A0A2P2FKA4_AMYLU|nr:M23 family metallopeptidase [Amycolatopsis lurida]KFU77139.1 LasA protease [Amycolatopsis lurida NRRL 2430]SEE49568.1 Peptidase family M23 [Amycolatopsis lurida]